MTYSTAPSGGEWGQDERGNWGYHSGSPGSGTDRIWNPETGTWDIPPSSSNLGGGSVNWGSGGGQTGIWETNTPGTQTQTTTPTVPGIPAPSFNYTPTLPDLGDIQLPGMPEMPEYNAPAAPVMPTFEAPEAPSAPKFQAPAWSEKAISSMAQKKAAPGVRGLKEGLREMTAKMGNDPISRHNAREAMTGYGRGLSQVMGEAHSAAVQEYSAKYGYQFQAAAMDFEAEADAIARKYQGDLTGRLAEYNADVGAVMAKYQADVSAENVQFQAAFQSMMNQYQIEAQASMAQYETEANQANLLVQLEQQAAIVDFQSLMTEYMAQFGSTTTTTQEPTITEQIRGPVQEGGGNQPFGGGYPTEFSQFRGPQGVLPQWEQRVGWGRNR